MSSRLVRLDGELVLTEGVVTLADLIAYAERFGVEFVFEMGDDLTAAERAVLADRLRDLDPGWRPPRAAVGVPLAVSRQPRAQEDHPPRPAVAVTQCGFCDAALEGGRADRHYCSDAHRQAAYRRRRGGER